MNQQEKDKLKEAFETIKNLAPNIYKILDEGFYVINCDKKSDIEQIESVIKIYLHAKGIKLTPRAIELLVMYVKYDTSSESRKKIRRQIKMTAGTLNQNTSSLKRAGILKYPYKDSKKSEVDPALVRLREYMNKPKKGNILIKYNE
ncbi:MAG: hypothetical protein KDH96_02465 [Candidatus Riesia sp.]|nr:hypothetical protein [Candidatus Riesia sp.]